MSWVWALVLFALVLILATCTWNRNDFVSNVSHLIERNQVDIAKVLLLILKIASGIGILIVVCKVFENQGTFAAILLNLFIVGAALMAWKTIDWIIFLILACICRIVVLIFRNMFTLLFAIVSILLIIFCVKGYIVM